MVGTAAAFFCVETLLDLRLSDVGDVFLFINLAFLVDRDV